MNRKTACSSWKKYALIITMSSIFQMLSLHAQNPDPGRFADQVRELVEASPASGLNGPILFTGSSSVRMWHRIAEDLGQPSILNMGFGGSQMSDLLHYAQLLIIAQRPGKVFIYEGDNDIAHGKAPSRVMRDTRRLLRLLGRQLPGVPVVLISSKPSPSRWNLKNKYERLNRKMERLCRKKQGLAFADVWAIMLDEAGRPRADIFLEDQLHMNQEGYNLWAEVIRNYL